MASWVYDRLTDLLDCLTGNVYSPPSPAGHSPDTTSSLYPDRPIRPLPKRRIRSRLSPEVADSILYPPTPSSVTPLFHFPYGRSASEGLYTNSLPTSKQVPEPHTCEHGYEHDHHHDDELDSEEEEEEGPSILSQYRGQGSSVVSNAAHSVNGSLAEQRSVESSGAQQRPPQAQSTASSADGYDSFENTNNKKKRKIPTSGSMTNHQSHLSAELANMGISSPSKVDTISDEDTVHEVGQGYRSAYSAIPSSGSGTGISGAGRGRFGRPAARNSNGKSPLGLSTDGSNAWAAGRNGRNRRDWVPGGIGGGKGDATHTDRGIISAAIASAAENGPSTPPKGQENVSLLQQQSSKKSSPAQTQFTFTCESDAGKNMVWPSPNGTLTSGHPSMVAGNVASGIPGVRSQGARGVSTQGTQTSPNMGGALGGQSATPQQGKKTRRRPDKEYALAARQRRLQQEYNNYHHPPSREDIWICEFCEYESIFGVQPEALVKQYEIKDRTERKRLAEKRRLLEKAKMKNRKGKKGGKAASKNSNAGTQQQQSGSQRYDQQGGDVPLQGQDAQSEEYLAEDYDDEPIPVATPAVPAKGSSQGAHHQTAGHPGGTADGSTKGIGGHGRAT
ncbi:MAG: hypothetical protein M1819_006619 [Sarea resinae]|nr:MAG: hypothetical protein M1819_006619 [Sarea resinae]